MKQGYLRVCIVLDSSGSMGTVEDDVKGSFNTFINEQRKAPGQTVLDVYQFSDETKQIVKNADLSTFDVDLMRDYRCSGCTALNDAVCQAIDELGETLSKTPEEERPETVLFAILTDGEENSSVRFTQNDVKARIELQSSVYSWNFVFLAAGIDVFKTGKSLGVQKEDCVAFDRSAEGLESVHCCLMERAASLRGSSKRSNDALGNKKKPKK